MDNVSISTPSVSSMVPELRSSFTPSEDISAALKEQTKKPASTTSYVNEKQRGFSSQQNPPIRLQRGTFEKSKAVQSSTESLLPCTTRNSSIAQQIPLNALSSSQYRTSSPLSFMPPVCKIDGPLAISSVLNYSQEELRDGGPLMLSRGLTITDV